MPRPTSRRFSMEPPQVEPAITTRTGCGQYCGCPEIRAEPPFRSTRRVAVLLRLDLQHRGRLEVFEEDPSFNLRLDDIVIHFVAEIGMRREQRCCLCQGKLTLCSKYKHGKQFESPFGR